MDPDRQREIARKGGKAAHEKGTAHQFTSDEAREAGRKGGQVVSQHREHMVEIGRSGGRARRRRRSDVPGNEGSMPMNQPDQGEDSSGQEYQSSAGVQGGSEMGGGMGGMGGGNA
jgi:general stress protein YciG